MSIVGGRDLHVFDCHMGVEPQIGGFYPPISKWMIGGVNTPPLFLDLHPYLAIMIFSKETGPFRGSLSFTMPLRLPAAPMASLRAKVRPGRFRIVELLVRMVGEIWEKIDAPKFGNRL